ncbi:hypothetical protein KML003_22330 [Klebsiella quasipneumoniae subsp. similipneumoniae]|nr:hypothetical protein KML003_22330 [Klebsiella quasipneumoniae subsp. similipneumoniae]
MPGFSAALGLVPASCVRHPSPQGIVSFPLPVSTGVITVWQAWHPRLEQAPDHRWLRQRVREVCRE